LVFITGVLAPAIVLLLIWLPVLTKYWVGSLPVSTAQIENLKNEPADQVLEEIGRQSFAVMVRPDQPLALRSTAEGILQGELALPGYPPVILGRPFRLEDLERATDTLGLNLASLAEVRILLDAYAYQPREEFLAMAVKRYVEFVQAERKAWLPHGFLWNDHAIAARISLSADLWRLVRKDDRRFGTAIEAELPLHVLRSMRMLADPTQYTYATNHGVMQNIALLQAAAAFPALPEARKLAELARDRLNGQLGHYLSPEGMVLEHSAGYHKHGVELLTIAIRAAELAGVKTPSDWMPRVTKARAILETIRRPDGSLPRFGNTFASPEPVHDFVPLVVQAPRDGLTALPVSGFSFWRTSGPTPCNVDGVHLSLAASFFPGHGHKLADEGSLMLWAGGRAWFDNTGYWPYGYPGRSDVDGWRGSNAPHFASEASDLARAPNLDHASEENGLLFLAFSRSRANSQRLHRQILGIDGGAWFVVDIADSPNGKKLQSLWTFDPGLQVRAHAGPASGFEVFDPDLPCVMDFQLTENNPPSSEAFRGKMSPFGGWMVQDRKPVPASAVEMTSLAGRVAILFALRNAMESPAVLESWQADSAEHWRARMKLPTLADVEVVRSGNRIELISGISRRELKLAKLPTPDTEREVIAASLQRLAERYPKQRDYFPWRFGATKTLLGLAAIALLILVVVFWRFAKWIRPLCWTGLSAWLMLSLWLHIIYFA
jgi:hypothetical protein